MSKLVNGNIKAGEQCPFKERCTLTNGEGASLCRRELSMVEFSCGVARAYDLLETAVNPDSIHPDKPVDPH